MNRQRHFNERVDQHMLSIAARAAVRGVGSVEPNPPVGCVIGTQDGTVYAVGHHRRYGEAHAEINALRACKGLGRSVRGATAWVTLEPCAHHGKTPPCADALARAGIARVVIARRDPHKDAAGGAQRLCDAGVDVHVCEACQDAVRISDPFVLGVKQGRPWVVAKWAQTIDGKIATSTGESKWISNARSRNVVHKMRARAGAIVTGAGTVAADDPLLTARKVGVRRVAARVVIDPGLRTLCSSRLARTAKDVPLLVVGAQGAAAARQQGLNQTGAGVVLLPAQSGLIEPAAVLETVAERTGATIVMLEAGPGTIGRFFDAGLVDEAFVFVAPKLLGDEAAVGPAAGKPATNLAHAHAMELAGVRKMHGDVLLRYRRRRSEIDGPDDKRIHPQRGTRGAVGTRGEVRWVREDR